MSDSERNLFRSTVINKLVPGLESGSMPSGLRLKRYKSVDDAWEITWDYGNGMRAIFRYGPEKIEGKTHVIWIMVGDHLIL